MSHRRGMLARRRSMLLQRSDKQRENLVLRLHALDSRLRTADGGIAALQRAVTNPLVIALAVAAFLSLRRRPGLRLLMRGVVLLAAGRRISRELGHLCRVNLK